MCPPTGFVCVRVGRRHKCREQWYDVNCRAGVALPMGFPDQVSGRNFSEGESNVTLVIRIYINAN